MAAPKTEKANTASRNVNWAFGGAAMTALVAFALALAAISASAAFSASIGRALPEAAVNLWPANGWTQTRASRQIFAAEFLKNGETMPETFPPRMTQLAILALRNEPMSSSALYNLAVAAQNDPDKAKFRALLGYSSQLSRRGSATNLLLVEDYALRGKNSEALRHYDILLRTNTRASAAIMPTMAKMLATPGVADELYQLMQRDPPWKNDFWAAVIQDGTVLKPGKELRMKLLGKQDDLQQNHDALMIAGLLKQGDVSDALELYEAASGQQTQSGNEALTNANFSSKPEFAPIDWLLVAEELYGAEYDARASGVSVTALEGAKGTVLQQLIALSPGQFTVAANIEQITGQAPALAISLTCAEAGAPFSITQPLTNGRAQFDYRGACRNGWFSVMVDEVTDQSGANFMINSMSMQKSGS